MTYSRLLRTERKDQTEKCSSSSRRRENRSEKVPERKDGDEELSGEGSPSKHLRPGRIKQRL